MSFCVAEAKLTHNQRLVNFTLAACVRFATACPENRCPTSSARCMRPKSVVVSANDRWSVRRKQRQMGRWGGRFKSNSIWEGMSIVTKNLFPRSGLMDDQMMSRRIVSATDKGWGCKQENRHNRHILHIRYIRVWASVEISEMFLSGCATAFRNSMTRVVIFVWQVFETLCFSLSERPDSHLGGPVSWVESAL